MVSIIVKRTEDYEPFKAVDGSEIVEVIGIPATGTEGVSLARAVVKTGGKTEKHTHDFLEIYMITKGEGIMHINDESKNVCIGDNILIPRGESHWIENTGKEDLEIWCICVPAFTAENTNMMKE